MRCRAKLGRLSRRGRRYAHAVAGNRIPFLCCADRLASASPSWATRSSFRFYRTGITAAYVDFDQIGLCYPQPSDDPEVLILAQLAKPYSRATATCAAASVVRSETAAIRPAAALSPDLAARSKSLAAQVPEVWAGWKGGHDVSFSSPWSACRADQESPRSAVSQAGGGQCPARGPRRRPPAPTGARHCS